MRDKNTEKDQELKLSIKIVAQELIRKNIDHLLVGSCTGQPCTHAQLGFDWAWNWLFCTFYQCFV